MEKITVDETQAGSRLDVFISKHDKKYSRSIWQKLISEGFITVNDADVEPKYKLKIGDSIAIKDYTPAETVDLPVIYEDENVLVVNKPRGVISHLKSDLESEPSVASFIKDKTTADGGNRAGIVHRLDRDTSGVMITALNEETRAYLARQFNERNVKKWYVAVCDNVAKTDTYIVEGKIRRSNSNPSKFVLEDTNGKDSKSDIFLLGTHMNKSIFLVRPYTGRTHQIRIHLTSIGYPIIGDKLYNSNSSDEAMLLHAWQLEITIQEGDRRTFSSDIPKDMSEYIEDEGLDTARAIIERNQSKKTE